MTIAPLIIVAVVALLAILGLLADIKRRELSWDRKEKEWGVERKDLLDRLMFMADRPWNVPETVPVASPPRDPSYDAFGAPLPSEFDNFDDLLELPDIPRPNPTMRV